MVRRFARARLDTCWTTASMQGLSNTGFGMMVVCTAFGQVCTNRYCIRLMVKRTGFVLGYIQLYCRMQHKPKSPFALPKACVLFSGGFPHFLDFHTPEYRWFYIGKSIGTTG